MRKDILTKVTFVVLIVIIIFVMFGITEFVWEWPSDKYPENYRMLAPRELSEKEYYSRFVRGLWVVPDVTEENLAMAAIAAGEARFEFGENVQIDRKSRI